VNTGSIDVDTGPIDVNTGLYRSRRLVTAHVIARRHRAEPTRRFGRSIPRISTLPPSDDV